jgi:tRNA(His) guanylyltransferase
MKDSLGDRMKGQYESRTQSSLPRRTYTIIRCDGKAFHTFTRGCKRPFDQDLADAMAFAATELCREAQGACFGYVQSDEISVLLTDFATDTTQAWFDGNVQKITSIAASVVTAAFNSYWSLNRTPADWALFDARVFTIPDPTEVENYFIWRQQDASRNSLSMLAQHHFSHAELQGKVQAEMHQMLHLKGINWNDCPTPQKRGTGIIKDTGWRADGNIPVWTADRNWLTSRIPRY